jgi:PrtD family type I secretion system ABC transporter
MPAAVTQRLDEFAQGRSPAPRPERGRSGPVTSPVPASAGDASQQSSANAEAAPPRQLAQTRSGSSEIKAAIAASKPAFVGIGVLSLLINLLMLTGPLFMLQVYDRVMTSGSMSTLIVLSAMTALLYAMTGYFELIRTRIVARAGVEIDQRLSDRIFKASLRRSLYSKGASVSALRDLDNVRQFSSGPAPMTFFDAPWTPIYLLVIFLVHWVLGVAALLGTALILGIALMSERAARESLSETGKASIKGLEMADSAQRNVEALAAMGMVEAYRKRWQNATAEALTWQVAAADKVGTASSISKSIRLLLQSMMLAVGAALAIHGDITAGSIIAGTIIFGRALAPVEQAVGQWKSFVKARESFEKLAKLLHEEPEPPVRTALPPPKGHVVVSQLRVASPDTRKLILANLNFAVRPGEVCAVIGPSASGKSTLARTLVGLWPPFSGTITIDGADLQQWNPEALGRYMGYLPQDVELFSGTVRDNICRFREDASDAAVIEAAKMAHAHELILALPQGYDTQLGSFGTYLSAGQRQRIGLARALFGNPAFLVLDEPNANLDRMGDEALSSALAGMKKRGQAVILISHRVQAMGNADTLLYLERGVQRAFGPQAEVMKLFRQSGPGSKEKGTEPSADNQGAKGQKPGPRSPPGKASTPSRPAPARDLPRPPGEPGTTS